MRSAVSIACKSLVYWLIIVFAVYNIREIVLPGVRTVDNIECNDKLDSNANIAHGLFVQPEITDQNGSEVQNEAYTTHCSMSQRLQNARYKSALRHNGTHFDTIISPYLSLNERYEHFKSLWTDDDHKVLVSFNAKTASSTIKTMLIHYAQNYSQEPKVWDWVHTRKYLGYHNIHWLPTLSQEDIMKRLKTYSYMTHVRHPLVRVYSAYKQKLATEKPPHCQFYQETMGVEIAKTLRKDFDEKDPWNQCIHDVTFQEFVEYFIDHATEKILKDEHWKPFYVSNQPAYIPYDYIIKLETAQQDIANFTKHYLNPRPGDTFTPLVNAKQKLQYEDGDYSVILEEFKSIPEHHLQALIEIYREDFEVFGYDVIKTSDGSLKATCCVKTETGCCC